MQKPCTKKVALILRYQFALKILIGSLFFSAPLSHAGDKGLPFSIGEKIEYSIRWQMIRAGTATFKILPFTAVNGEKAYHFILRAKSNRYIDRLYKLRLQMDGFSDIRLDQSLLYKKIQSGKENKDVTVQFDWETKTATYSNFGKKRDPISISLKTLDPVSCFYKIRSLYFETDQVLSFPVTNGKKCFVQEGRVMAKEMISISAGTFDTYRIIPQVNHFSGVFKKSKNPKVTLWVTADDKKIPVRIKVKVFIGSIIFDLVSIKPGSETA